MACGTRRPSAIVCAFSHVAAFSAPASNARTIGAQPAACTVTMCGRVTGSIQPSAAISANAFHMPTMPVPPPVG